MDTVTNPQTDEEIPTKEEKMNKLQPTSEQLRLAQITQDSTLDPQRKGKISQVIDFTGKSEDEVATALFDCSWDVQRAIEFLLEEGGDLGSWEESGKKKKKKVTGMIISSLSTPDKILIISGTDHEEGEVEHPGLSVGVALDMVDRTEMVLILTVWREVVDVEVVEEVV